MELLRLSICTFLLLSLMMQQMAPSIAGPVAGPRRPQVTPEEDQEPAASHHGHHGRVQIKVYRGPDHHDDHGHHYAPHGYWVKQPADDAPHHER